MCPVIPCVTPEEQSKHHFQNQSQLGLLQKQEKDQTQTLNSLTKCLPAPYTLALCALVCHVAYLFLFLFFLEDKLFKVYL